MKKKIILLLFPILCFSQRGIIARQQKKVSVIIPKTVVMPNSFFLDKSYPVRFAISTLIQIKKEDENGSITSFINYYKMSL